MIETPINLSIDFVSGVAESASETSASTGDALSLIFILCTLFLSIASVAGFLFLRHKEKLFNNGTSLHYKNSCSKIFKVFQENAKLKKVTIAISAVLIAMCLIGLFASKQAFAGGSQPLTPDTNKITATVQEDGRISFSSCNLINTSGMPYSLKETSVVVPAESQSVAAINSAKLTINGFGGCAYDGIPNGEKFAPIGISGLEEDASTPLTFNIENLDKESALALCGKQVYSITFIPAKAYSVTYEKGEIQDSIITGNAPVDDVLYVEGASVIVKDQGSLEAENYVFDGWKDNATQQLYSAGSTFNISTDISLIAQWKREIISVTGTAIFSTDSSKPAPNATVKFVTDGGDIYETTTNAEGVFKLEGVPKGISGTLTITSQGGSLTITKDNYEASEIIKDPVVVENPVYGDTGFNGVAKDNADQLMPGAKVYFVSDDGKWYPEGSPNYVTTDASGNYEFSNVKPQTQGTLHVVSDDDKFEGSTPVESPTSGSQVQQEVKTDTISITEITGIAKDPQGNPLPKGAKVRFVTIDEQTGKEIVYESEVVDENGNFSIPNVPGGAKGTIFITYTTDSGKSYNATIEDYETSKVNEPINVKTEEEEIESVQVDFLFSGLSEESEATIYEGSDFQKEVRSIEVSKGSTVVTTTEDIDGVVYDYITFIGSNTNKYYVKFKTGFAINSWSFNPELVNNKIMEKTTVTADIKNAIYEIKLNAGDFATSKGTQAIYEKYGIGWFSDKECSTSFPSNKIIIPTWTDSHFGGYSTTVQTVKTPIVDNDGTIVATNTTFKSDTELSATWLTAYAELLTTNTENDTLEFKFDSEFDASSTTMWKCEDTGTTAPGWVSLLNEVDAITFDDSFANARPKSCYEWFKGAAIVEIHGLNKLNTEDVENMYGMFENCTSLESLELINFDVSKVQYMDNMFSGCTSLEAIYCNDNWKEKAKSLITSTGMFKDCVNLINYNGEFTDVDKAYPHLDEATGYFSYPSYAELVVTNPEDATIEFKYGPDYDPSQEDETMWRCEDIKTSYPPWRMYVSDAADIKVTTIKFDASFKNARPKSCESWFDGTNTETGIESSTLEAIYNLEYLNTASVLDMNCMFYACSKLETLNVYNFDTSEVTDMDCMFYGCSNLQTLNVYNFDTSKVTYMSSMFQDCIMLETLDLSSFKTKNVDFMSYMFSGCTNLKTINLNSFDLCNVNDRAFRMFAGCENLQYIYCDNDWSSLGFTNNEMFKGCTKLPNFDSTKTDTTYAYPNNGETGYFTKVPTAYAQLSSSSDQSKNDTLTFKWDNNYTVEEEGKTMWKCEDTKTSYPPWHKYINNSDDIKVTTINFNDSFKNARPKSCVSWFDGFNYKEHSDSSTIKTINNLEYLDTSNVTDMQDMFYACSNLQTLNVENFDTSNVTDMEDMFYGCSNLQTLNVENFSTSNVTSMCCMFERCSNLQTLNVANFNTSNVDDMCYMFYGCSNIQTLNVENFDTSNVTDMSSMFYNCSNLKNIYCDNNWVNVASTKLVSSEMFLGCTNLPNYDEKETDIKMAKPISQGGYFTVGKISGTVVDSKGVVISGANVKFREDGTPAITQEDGKFEIFDVVGKGEIIVSAEGYGITSKVVEVYGDINIDTITLYPSQEIWITGKVLMPDDTVPLDGVVTYREKNLSVKCPLNSDGSFSLKIKIGNRTDNGVIYIAAEKNMYPAFFIRSITTPTHSIDLGVLKCSYPLFIPDKSGSIQELIFLIPAISNCTWADVVDFNKALYSLYGVSLEIDYQNNKVICKGNEDGAIYYEDSNSEKIYVKPSDEVDISLAGTGYYMFDGLWF